MTIQDATQAFISSWEGEYKDVASHTELGRIHFHFYFIFTITIHDIKKKQQKKKNIS